MFENCILPSLIRKLNLWAKNSVLWIVIGSKECFWEYDVTINGLDKYNAMFQNVKRVLHQNKAHTKISWGLQFCKSISYTFLFPAYIFAIILGGKPKDSLILAKTDWFILVASWKN